MSRSIVSRQAVEVVAGLRFRSRRRRGLFCSGTRLALRRVMDAFQWPSGDASVAGALWARCRGESYRQGGAERLPTKDNPWAVIEGIWSTDSWMNTCIECPYVEAER